MTEIAFDIIGFDLDGTLLETSGDLAAAVNHAIATIGLPPFPVERIRAFVGSGARVMLRRALAAAGRDDPALLEELLPILFDHYANNVAMHSRPYPGLIAALDQLRDMGARLAICTNKIERFTLPLIEQLGLTRYFSAIVGGDTVGVLKPDPAPLHAMIGQAGGGRCLFVGDTTNDSRAARALGVPCVIVSFGYCDGPPHQLGGDVVIDHFDQLAPLVRDWPR
ncbi:MAG: phosphoglycolate phosphatase [Sphingobium sp. 32-64-5]|nr:MAG: phosphoglycolate phosphatase [Sphingobium sp. 32-64-5]